MKKVWIKVVNDPQIENRYSDDWLHAYTVSTTPLELEPEEVDDFVDLFELEIEDEATTFYVVLFFFENYFADHYAFTHLADATECFYEQIRTRQELRTPDEYQVIEKSWTGEITSSVYEKDKYSNFDRYQWPDKSTRWILKKFDLSEDC
jgi:hypothetical protein